MVKPLGKIEWSALVRVHLAKILVCSLVMLYLMAYPSILKFIFIYFNLFIIMIIETDILARVQ